MKAVRYIYFLAMLLVLGCNKDSIEIAPNYPTIVNEIDENQLLSVVDKINQTTLSGCVSVDRFGYPFIDLKNEYCFIDSLWQVTDSLESIKQRAMQAFSDYAYLLNVDQPIEVEVQSVTTINKTNFEQFFLMYPDSFPQVWLVTSGLQQQSGLSIRSTGLYVLLTPYGVVGIGGHWFNNVLIPSVDNFDEEKAKNLLINQTIKQGNNSITINENTNWNDSRKIIQPVFYSNKIELRVCWALYPEGWELVVDTQSGDIITSTKIS